MIILFIVVILIVSTTKCQLENCQDNIGFITYSHLFVVIYYWDPWGRQLYNNNTPSAYFYVIQYTV